jgi:hypothetical protein
VASGNHHRLLYHFADVRSAETAIADGTIAPSAVSMRGVRTRRDVVWLTEAPEIGSTGLPAAAAGPDRHAEGEQLVRFTVAVGDAQHWRHWAARHKVRRRTRRDLEARGEGLSDLWWVVGRPIDSDEWLVVDQVGPQPVP